MHIWNMDPVFGGKLNKYAIILAIIVILFIIIIYNNMRMYKVYSNQLEGLWMAPESFCKQSDIDGMLVYVGPLIGGSGILNSEHRKVCLIIHGNNTTIAYKKLEITMSSAVLDVIIPFVGINSVWTRSAKVVDDTDEVADSELDIMDESDDVSTIALSKILPERLTITVDLNEGKMLWIGGPLPGDKNKNGEQITYAELFKDNASSAIGKNLIEAPESIDFATPDIPDVA
jgi:hypothetical protein